MRKYLIKVAPLPWEYSVRDDDSSSFFLVGASFWSRVLFRFTDASSGINKPPQTPQVRSFYSAVHHLYNKVPKDWKHLLVILLSCVLFINLTSDIRSLCERMGRLYSCYLRRLECLIIGRGVILLPRVLFHNLTVTFGDYAREWVSVLLTYGGKSCVTV